MNKFFRVSLSFFVIFVFLSGSCPALEESPFLDPEIIISMDLKDANLKDILKILSIQSGLNFIASEAVQNRTMTLYFDKVMLKEAMDKIFSANNLSYELDKTANIFLVKDWGKPQIETVTKIFYLKNATVSSSSLKEEMKNNTGAVMGASSSGSTLTSTSDTSGTSEGGKWKTEEDAGITSAVKKLLTPVGLLIEDYRTNSLIITDIPSRMPVIEKVISALDVPVSQVMLEVEMLDVSKSAVDRLGFKYGTTPFTVILSGASASLGAPFGNWGKLFDRGSGGISINEVTAPDGADYSYKVALDFLSTQTDTKYLARPRLLTLNNETAEIKITTDEAIGIISSQSGEGAGAASTQEAERYQTGVSLRVTPQINPDTGEVTLFILPSVSDATQAVEFEAGGETATFKNPETRATRSVVRIKDGDTVVIGGLIRHDKGEVITKVPFLGDIPLLGKLFFTNRTTTPNRERELLVFITPRIVNNANKVELAQTIAPAFPAREQDTASGLNRQLAVATSLDKFETR